jgi:hypothetical protein
MLPENAAGRTVPVGPVERARARAHRTGVGVRKGWFEERESVSARRRMHGSKEGDHVLPEAPVGDHVEVIQVLVGGALPRAAASDSPSLVPLLACGRCS